jgi:hypothetical protein
MYNMFNVLILKHEKQIILHSCSSRHNTGPFDLVCLKGFLIQVKKILPIPHYLLI